MPTLYTAWMCPFIPQALKELKIERSTSKVTRLWMAFYLVVADTNLRGYLRCLPTSKAKQKERARPLESLLIPLRFAPLRFGWSKGSFSRAQLLCEALSASSYSPHTI